MEKFNSDKTTFPLVTNPQIKGLNTDNNFSLTQNNTNMTAKMASIPCVQIPTQSMKYVLSLAQRNELLAKIVGMPRGKLEGFLIRKIEENKSIQLECKKLRIQSEQNQLLLNALAENVKCLENNLQNHYLYKYVNENADAIAIDPESQNTLDVSDVDENFDNIIEENKILLVPNENYVKTNECLIVESQAVNNSEEMNNSAAGGASTQEIDKDTNYAAADTITDSVSGLTQDLNSNESARQSVYPKIINLSELQQILGKDSSDTEMMYGCTSLNFPFDNNSSSFEKDTHLSFK